MIAPCSSSKIRQTFSNLVIQMDGVDQCLIEFQMRLLCSIYLSNAQQTQDFDLYQSGKLSNYAYQNQFLVCFSDEMNFTLTKESGDSASELTMAAIINALFMILAMLEQMVLQTSCFMTHTHATLDHKYLVLLVSLKTLNSYQAISA